MFNKNELCILLESLESNKATTMISCIYCDIVDDRCNYSKTNYCKNYCNISKYINDIETLISKIKNLLN